MGIFLFELLPSDSEDGTGVGSLWSNKLGSLLNLDELFSVRFLFSGTELLVELFSVLLPGLVVECSEVFTTFVKLLLVGQA